MTQAECENKEEVIKQLETVILDEMDEYAVVIESPYAEFVEYGTHPAKKTEAVLKIRDPEAGDFVTPARLNMRNWVARRDSISGEERKKAGDRMYKHIMEKGLKPHPFIRPAIRDAEYLMPDYSPEKFNDMSYTGAYAEFIAKQMRYYLKQNKTEGLVEKIKVKKADEVSMHAKVFDRDKKDVDGRGAF